MYWIVLLRNISKVGIAVSIITIIISSILFYAELKSTDNSEKTVEETSLLRNNSFMIVGYILIVIFGLIEVATR